MNKFSTAQVAGDIKTRPQEGSVSEEQAPSEPDAPEQPQEGEQGGQDTFDAEYVAKLRKENAKYRTEAKANADAARKLAEIEDASKSEQERLTEKLAELEREAQTARAEALRFKIASKYGVSDEDADLFLTGTDEETLAKQAERLASRNEDASRPRAPKPDLNQGRQSSGSASTADQFAASIGGML